MSVTKNLGINAKNVKKLILLRFSWGIICSRGPRLIASLFFCTYCEYKGFSAVSLRVHIIRHHTKKFPLICNLCGIGFTKNCKLKQHYDVKHQGVVFFCNICKKEFKSKYSLTYHQVVHQLNRKTFDCDQCEKKFKMKASLRKHVLNHTGQITNHICELCGKTFSQKDYLRIHQRIHTHKKNLFAKCVPKDFIRRNIWRYILSVIQKRNHINAVCVTNHILKAIIFCFIIDDCIGGRNLTSAKFVIKLL